LRSGLRRATMSTAVCACACTLIIALSIISLFYTVSYTSGAVEVEQELLYGFFWYSAEVDAGQLVVSRMLIEGVETSAHITSANEEYARESFFLERRPSVRAPVAPGWRINFSPIWNRPLVSWRERLGLRLPHVEHVSGMPEGLLVSIPFWSVLL